MSQQYAKPEVLVSTDWVLQHHNDPNVRVVEVDVDTSAYAQGHVPGALGWNWTTELCDTLVRDIVPANKLEELLGRSGIGNDTIVVLYGDNNNWFAAWAFWQLKIYGHDDVRIMNGGRKKWLEEGRELSTEVPSPARKTYKADPPNLALRAFLPEVQKAYLDKHTVLIDVRGPQEFTGEILSPPGLPETCQRGGHIPGAKNVPWAKACNEDGTFKSVEELKQLYGSQGVKADTPVIAYCRIGERSSHTWFVLKYLVGSRRRQELRRLVDGVGQPGGRSGAKAVKTDQGRGLRASTPQTSRRLEVQGEVQEASGMQAEDYQRRQETAQGWPINIVSYRIGERYYCTIDNVDPGARIARSEGQTRDEAEQAALTKATKYLGQTRRFSQDGSH